ncbi:ribonuclease BN [Marmoricola sp. Leaf446]|uniref:YhjD/YihY/BrkB family envelope integrity protein n=1 Tax=Marmoricola sp. Leaf446 TaxID=1736379 RepID=UPI0006F6160C|nr:YhjD/YihY/BrkB family envelope integrity protein [Marmoricola sp. Leaf446]KQT94676.1 ribonuclease BN [Marmoricola sp. Leaf446]
MRATWSAEVRELVAGVRRTLSGRDLAAASATLTYFSGIAVVPWLLVGVWTQTWWYGDAGAADRLGRLDVLVPPDMGGRTPYDALVAAGTGVGLLGALVLLFPASFYGEGVRRACLAVEPREDSWTGWRARLAMTATVVAVPLLAWAWFAVGQALRPLSPEGGGGGAGDLVLRVLLGFTATWLALAVVLTWVFRAVAPGRPRWWVAVLGGLATGSFLAGFLQGFWLFLSIPIDVGLPFAGLGVVGGVVAVGLWLYVLHVFLLVGWTTTRVLDDRVGRAVAS